MTLYAATLYSSVRSDIAKRHCREESSRCSKKAKGGQEGEGDSKGRIECRPEFLTSPINIQVGILNSRLWPYTPSIVNGALGQLRMHHLHGDIRTSGCL